MNSNQQMDVTEIPELDVFLQPRRAASMKIRSVPMRPGQSYKDAVREQDERIAKIKARNLAAATGEQA